MDEDNLESFSDDQLWAILGESENEVKVEILTILYDRANNSGEYAKAATLAEQISTEAAACMSNTMVENAYYKQGLAFWKAERFEEAIDAFNRGISQYEEPDSKIELTKNQWGVASSLHNLDKFEDSAKWANLSATTAVAEEAFSLAGISKFLEAQSLYLADRDMEALEACEVARRYRRQEQELKEVATIDAYMASIHAYSGNYDKAVDLLRNCLVLAEATSDRILYYSYRLGNALIDQGHYQEARSHLERARKGYEESDDHSSLAECFYSLCLTYRQEDEVSLALSNVRSAISLWDALGNDHSYLKGLEKLSILLFDEDLDGAIEINQRILDFIGNPNSDYEKGVYGWALLRLVDCLRQREEFETALSLIQATDLFGINSKHSGKNWHYSLKARILYALSRHEEAMGVADTALSQTSDEDVNSQTAYLYEIKARVSLELNRPDKERHLAHAIALHLAFGETRLARELSEYFKPKFTPIAEDQITSQTMDSIELIDNATPASTSGL